MHKRLFQHPVRTPAGQVLVATFLFIFIFTILFAALYKAGIAYSLKGSTVRGGDLTALSCGSVYANGLQLVRYSNMALMAAATSDIAVMVSAFVAAGGPADPLAYGAALAADPKTREKVQDLQGACFGVARDEDDQAMGVYPFLISLERYSLASDNRMESRPPIQPLFLYNSETSSAVQTLIPHMALRFRNADELFSGMDEVEEKQPVYRLRDRSSGQWRYFRFDQVEPAPGANPGQMRVLCGYPTDDRCKYVEKVGDDGDPGAGELPGLKWFLNKIRDILREIRLDVTHRDDPPCHTVLVYARLKARLSGGQPIDQISEILLTDGGLAAWDIFQPKFKARLKPLEPDRWPVVRDLLDKMPPWMKDVLGKTGNPLGIFGK